MLRLLIFPILLLFLCIDSFGQHTFGLQLGTSYYAGDLSNDPFDLKETQLGGNLFYGYYFSKKAQIKARLSYGTISGDDANKKTSASRALSFQTPIYEFAVVGSYDFVDINFSNFAPYAYAGMGVFHFNPKAEVNGQLVALQPLGTEGQGIAGFQEPYKLTQLAVPFGGGVKLRVSERMMIDADFGSKKTFTDYLDDVSGREYVAPSVLSQNGALAVEAAYNADAVGGRPYSDFEDPLIRKRYPRNLSTKRDWYYMLSIGAVYYIPKDRSLIPINRKGVPNRFP